MSKDFLYKKIENEILKEITTQKIKPGEKLGTTKELADHYSASTITINKALNNLSQKGYVKRIPRVGNIVNKELAWSSHNAPETRTKIIAAIVFDSSSPYLWAKALKGIETTLNNQSYHLVIGNDEGDIDRAITYIEELSEKGIEGFIIVPIGKEDRNQYEKENARLIHCVESVGRPYILFHRGLSLDDIGIVSIDNYNDTKRMMSQFLRSGIQNPICISHYFDTVVYDRERGFIDSLREAGIENSEDRILHTLPQSQTIQSRPNTEIAEFISTHSPVDGIFTLSGNLLHAAISSINPNVIDKVHFATFDYSDALYKHSSVKLIMIPPAFDMGQKAAEMLLSKIKDQNHIPSRLLLPSKFLSKLNT